MGGRATFEATLTTEGESLIKTNGVDLEVAAGAKFGKVYGDTSFNY